MSDVDCTHRLACHRCGNMRKELFKCAKCPYVFCLSCKEKLIPMYGIEAFGQQGCAVCLDLCCCGTTKSYECTREHHCYKKCLIFKLGKRSKKSEVNIDQDGNTKVGILVINDDSDDIEDENENDDFNKIITQINHSHVGIGNVVDLPNDLSPFSPTMSPTDLELKKRKTDV